MIFKYKIGDRVRVVEGKSFASRELNGQVGMITKRDSYNDTVWYHIDIKTLGLWEAELEHVYNGLQLAIKKAKNQ